MNAGPTHEKETSQKIIMSLAGVCFVALIALSVLDYRLGFSSVPAYISVIADLVVALSFLFIFWVTNVNSFAAANIQVEAEQKVIDTGPYAYVRHPMYAGAFWMLMAIPLALGSWHGVLLNLLFTSVLIWRLLDEERILRRDLAGYSAYTEKVHYRLIPGVW
jgi:protein-S-isoprenylcysteine O-methyltransferase Ste14